MIDLNSKVRTLKLRIATLKSELAYYEKLQQTEVQMLPFQAMYANLSSQQRTVTELYRKGNDIRHIAQILELSTKGVKFHLTKIYAAFRVSSGKELLTFLAQNMESYEQSSGTLCPRPAKGSAESSVRRLYSGPVSSNSGVSLPFGKPA